ncbi:MAG: CaiB/BaiF CoA transferase family protein, partial [Candidatus Entotheonellia bacterium]
MTYTLLAGLKVLELGRMISAPYCGKLLADMGAEVIKIEPSATGDPARQYGPFLHDDPHAERSGLFLYLNANKQGVTLNLATPTGQRILRDLVARSDVLVHNLPVQDMERVDYKALSRVNPALVMASITPFGLTGPYRHYTAYDINLAAAGGICTGLGEADREPLSFGTPQVGYFAGMAAASSIVMALLALDHVGGGQHIDIAEVESMAGVYNGSEALMAVYQWRMTRRTGHHALDFPYPNCILRCKDGYIFVGAPEGRQWRQLLEVMGNPAWSKDPRFRNRTEMNNRYADELDGYLEAWLMQYTKAELLAIALEHRIPLAPVRGY